MPNGESKNWVRLQITLRCFYARYGHWPASVTVYPFFIEELKVKLSVEDLIKLQGKLLLIPVEDNLFVASDSEGNEHRYGYQVATPDLYSTPNPIEWLGVNDPDYDA